MMEAPRQLVLQVDSCAGCPMCGVDGGPGPVTVCNHPDCPKDKGYGLERSYSEGFPEWCPLEEAQ